MVDGNDCSHADDRLPVGVGVGRCGDERPGDADNGFDPKGRIDWKRPDWTRGVDNDRGNMCAAGVGQTNILFAGVPDLAVAGGTFWRLEEKDKGMSGRHWRSHI